MEFNSKYGVDIDHSIKDKVFIVTGGLGGIAMATNEMLLSRGAKLALCYPPFEENILQNKLDSLSNFRDKVKTYKCDITSIENIKTSIEHIISDFNQIDGIVNCVGYVHLDKAENINIEEWNKQLSINLTGPFLVNQLIAKYLIENNRRGKIINISSQAATVAIDKHVAYTAAKAGLIGMTKVMALEWAKYGINVNTISPTVVLTPMGEKAWQGRIGEEMKEKIPMGRFAYTDEIAAAIIFMLSNGSDMITGADLIIDGGYTIY